MYEARMRRMLCFFWPMLQGACAVAGLAFLFRSLLSGARAESLRACFAFRLGSTAFTASLYFQLTYVLLSLIRRALHCGIVVFSFLIAKVYGKQLAVAATGLLCESSSLASFGSPCPCQRSSLVLLTSALKKIEPHPPVRAWYRERRSPSHLP